MTPIQGSHCSPPPPPFGSRHVQDERPTRSLSQDKPSRQSAVTLHDPPSGTDPIRTSTSGQASTHSQLETPTRSLSQVSGEAQSESTSQPPTRPASLQTLMQVLKSRAEQNCAKPSSGGQLVGSVGLHSSVPGPDPESLQPASPAARNATKTPWIKIRKGIPNIEIFLSRRRRQDFMSSDGGQARGCPHELHGNPPSRCAAVRRAADAARGHLIASSALPSVLLRLCGRISDRRTEPSIDRLTGRIRSWAAGTHVSDGLLRLDAETQNMRPFGAGTSCVTKAGVSLWCAINRGSSASGRGSYRRKQ